MRHRRPLLFGVLAVAITGGATVGIFKAQSAPTTLRIAPVKSEEDRTKLLKSGEPPIQLTSSDGSGLRLASVKAAAAIEDPLALTELHLTFENPEARVREGTFRITLPQGASVSRFAMKVGEVWQEGEVVERQQARQVYEDLLHHNQDPALLEKAAGNEFTARVFPIPAKGTKEIIVAYSEVLEAGAPYIVPLKGLPTLSAIDIDVRALGANKAKLGGNGRWALHQTSLAPAEDFVVGAESLPRSSGLRSGELVVARVVPFTSSRPDPIESVVFLVDTSASRGLGLAEEAKLLEETIRKLPAEARVTVACFDQEVVPLFEGAAASYGDRDTKAIIERGALGASDFEGALAWAATEAQKKNARRVVLVTDGVATAGEIDNQRIKKEVEKLRAAKVERIDAIAVGGLRDDSFLRSIARAGVLDRDGAVLEGMKVGAAGLAARLAERTSSGIPIKVEGAAWSWPRTLDGLQAGDEIVVHAEVPAKQPVKVDVGGQVFTPLLRAATRPLVERSWAQAKIQSLIEAPAPTRENDKDAQMTKAAIIALSTRHRVVSPFTALLVLESEGQLASQGLSRNSNREILTVDDGRVAVLDESKNEKAKAKERDKERAKAEEEADSSKKSASSPKPAMAPAPAPTPAPASAPAPTSTVASNENKKLPPATKGKLADGEATATTTVTPATPAASAVAAPSSPPPPPVPPPVIAPTPPPKPDKDDSSLRAALTTDDNGNAETLEPSKRKAPAPDPSRHPPSPKPSTAPRNAPAPPPAPRGERRDLDRETATAPGPAVHVRSVVVVQSGLLRSEVEKALKQATSQIRACYNSDRVHDLDLQISLNATGGVGSVVALDGKHLEDAAPCMLAVLQKLKFPAPANGFATVKVRLTLATPSDARAELAPMAPRGTAAPYTGRYLVVMSALGRGEKQAALAEARKWHAEHPGDVMALLAFGEALEAIGDVRTAARAYGSILELYPMRADTRRFAGERLERLKDAAALRLVIDTYKKAVEQRPDHPESHRHYGYALLKHNEPEKAFEAIRAGALRQYPRGRFVGVERILHEDLGLVAAAWSHAEPHRAAEIKARLRAAGGSDENEPSLRFVLSWETDASDVDLHVDHGAGSSKSAGAAATPEHYANVRDGYGPECFTIRAPPDKRGYPFGLQVSYASRGPMGYGMGRLSIVEHDGKGNLVFDERPYVVMSDFATVDLGKVDRAVSTNAAEKLAIGGKAGF